MKILNNYKKPKPHGTFGYIRKYDIHTGVDLYCRAGSYVYAIENGTVMNIENFTGPSAGSPWWNDTKAVLVEGKSGVICYGEIEPFVKKWDSVKVGDVIGKVKRVLKKNKGLPVSMLHIELYKMGTKNTVFWNSPWYRPEELLDITPLLKEKGIL